MEQLNLSQSSLIDIIDWLTGLRAVTDFEKPALACLQVTCDYNGIQAEQIPGGLLIGNKEAKFVLVAHIDRIGFVAIDGEIKPGSLIQLSYISPSKKSGDIKLRFSNVLLIGYHPLDGQDLFLATLEHNKDESYMARVCHVFTPILRYISLEQPIPLTAVKPPLSCIGNYIQGYFDNSAGLAIALSAVAKHPNKLSCIVTTAEEGGGYRKLLHGGRGAQDYIRFHDLKKTLVVIDVRPSRLVKTDAQDTCVGAGVVLREEERRENPKLILKAHSETLDFLKNYARQHNIPIQLYNGGGITEAGRAMEVLDKDARLNVVWLQPPIEYEHTPFEVMTISDLIYTLQLTEALISS